MNREEKVTEVGELSGKFAKAKIAIVTDYKGLTVSVLQELRHNLRRNDAEFRVAKNTLLRRAVADTEYKDLQEHFIGTTAVAVSYGDPVSPAKILTDFCKDHPELQIRTAALDGKLLSADDITALAKLPSKEVLLGQMLSVMNAVPTGLVQVLSGVPRTFLYALQAIKEQKEQAAN
ncbi:MAG: 50S ribosomal protein L10 [Desulfobulbales bacterium]